MFSTRNQTIALAAGGAVVGALLLRRFMQQPPLPSPPPPPVTSSKRSTEGPEAVILYATQTGTAQLFAETLASECTQYKIPNRLVNAMDFTASDLQNISVLVVLTATYGEGDPVDDFREAFLELSDDTTPLDDLSFTVFGLGDTTYPLFCKNAIALDKTLTDRGAKQIYALGRGDTREDQEGAYDAWRSGLWMPLASALGIAFSGVMEECLPKYDFKFVGPEDASPLPLPPPPSVLEPSNKQPVFVPIKTHKQLLKNTKERSTLHVELDISGTAVTYQAGDHCGILPCNPNSVVAAYLTALRVPKEDWEKPMGLFQQKIKQNRATAENVLPAMTTLFNAFKWYIDLCGPAKKSTLRVLAQYCSDPTEKEHFQGLLGRDTQATPSQTLRKLMMKARTVLGILQHFESCTVPVGHFLESMPKIHPRYFSIASDQLMHPKEIHLTVAVVTGGLCTELLANAKVGDKVALFVRKSTFHLPMRNKERPAIMIGPGTGVAPLVGFCHRREAWVKRGHKIGEAMLFFGCRNKAEDHIYAEEMAAWKAANVLTHLFLAYSRDQDHKVYVQDRLKEHGAEVYRLIKDNANIYLCGDALHMAPAVESTLARIIAEHGGMPLASAENLLARMLKHEQYLKDVWTA